MFLNLPMLAGLGGAMIPLIVHLLARARYETVGWGAMMFLEGADAATHHPARIRQWLLLAIRMGLVGMLAFALSRPVVRQHWAGLAPGGHVTAVIVIDRSYSMAFEEAGRSRFDKAREAVLQILAGLRKGDEVALVLCGEQVTVPYPTPTSNLQAVARDVADLRPANSSANLPAALEVARTLLADPSRLNRELYLVTDRQAVSWQLGSSDSSGASMARFVNDKNSPTRFYVIPVGSEDVENVAIESVELIESSAVRAHPAEIEIRLRNYAATPRANVELTVSVTSPTDQRRPVEGGRKIKTLTLTVPPRRSMPVRVPVTFEQTGSHVITAEIKSPGLEADNRLDTAVDVIDPIQVLILSGDERASQLRKESFFLQLALTPYQTSGKKGSDAFAVTVQPAEELGGISLNRYSVIVLANIPQLTAEQARSIEQRVYEGAGLVVSPGNLVRVENYNNVLYRDGSGLLPARLEAAAPADPAHVVSLLGLDLSHPIFRFRRGADPLPSAVVARYFHAVPRSGDARVLASYSSGEPFLIEGTRGRGKVLLLTTPMDADWNTLPLYPFFLPFVQSLVRYADAPAAAPRNLLPGQPIVASFDKPATDITLNDRPLPKTAVGSRIEYADTFRPGVYRLAYKVGGKKQVLDYVVQAPRQESDLTPLSSQQWQKLENDFGFTLLNPSENNVISFLATQRGGREITLLLLGGVVLLAMTEVALTRLWT